MQTIRHEISGPFEVRTARVAASDGPASGNLALSAAMSALFERRASLEFHPIYSTGEDVRLAFYDASLLLHDEHGGVIPKFDYEHLADESGLGRDLDAVTLRLGLGTLAARPDLRLAIPMSARALADGRWRQELESGLAASPYLAERLILEVDEPSAMKMHEVLIRFMAEMQGRGVAFSLGHFGSGATNFGHLRRFHFDLAKIAPSFISHIETDADNQVVVGAMIKVGQEFDMFTVAPGVSTPEEASCLIRLGVDCMAGRFFGPPLVRL